MSERADLVVVGAGTVGGWASVFAREDGAGRVVVVDAGTAGQGASSRAAGMVRTQGGTPTAVDLGRWTVGFYLGQHERYGIDSDFRALGYITSPPARTTCAPRSCGWACSASAGSTRAG